MKTPTPEGALDSDNCCYPELVEGWAYEINITYMNNSKYSKKRETKKELNQSSHKLNTELSSKTKNHIQVASEKVLAKDWLIKKENKAWKNL